MMLRIVVALATALVVALAGCAGCEQVTVPPQDGNETRATAAILTLVDERTGSVHCIRTRAGQWAGDCADWYRIEATRPERIEVELRLRGTPASEPAYPLAIELWSADGTRRDRMVTDPNERAALAFAPEPPLSEDAPRTTYVVVKTIHAMTRPQGYRLRAVQDAAAPNHPPEVRIRASSGALAVGRYRAFRVTASDPDGDPVKIDVLVGGRVVASGANDVSYRFTGRTPGNYVVEARASDGKDTSVLTRAVRVVKPGPAPTPGPKPPKPTKFETVRNIQIFEVERAGGTVVIEFGGGAGAATGQKGRLVSGGKTIGHIEITEVYAEGSRAKLLGSPSEVITSATRAEIDVPR